MLYALKKCHHCSTKFKLVILDECDAMTKDAQFALRRGKIASQKSLCVEHGMPDLVMLHAVIEKYTRNARFCLICNYVSKIIPALQSRCTRFRIPPLGEDHVRDRLQHVIDSERWALHYDSTLFPEKACFTCSCMCAASIWATKAWRHSSLLVQVICDELLTFCRYVTHHMLS